MSSAPWLTVITVVKDDLDGFTRTLRSLSAQDLSGVEYVVVDSSTDRREIPDALASALAFAPDGTGASGAARSGSVTWVPPAGVYAAMNTGMSLASGDYLYFLNAGDELASADVLSSLRAAVSDSSPAWLFGDVEILGTDGSRVITPPWDYASERTRAFSGGYFPPHQGTVVRADLLREIGGFDTSFTIAADYAAFLRLASLADPLRLDVVIARFHEGGVSTQRWARSLAEFHRARRRSDLPGARGGAEWLATARQFLAMAAYRSPWPLAVLVVLSAWLVLTVAGVPAGRAAGVTALGTAQAVAGATWWRRIRLPRSMPILQVIGVGLGVAVVCAIVPALLGLWWLGLVLVLVLAAGAWVVPLRVSRRALPPLGPLPKTRFIGAAAGLVAVLLIALAVGAG